MPKKNKKESMHCTEKDLKIVVVKIVKRPHVRRFSTRKRLSSDVEYYNRPADCFREDEKNGVFNEAYVLAKNLFEIEAVDRVMIDGLDAFVTLGLAFSWTEPGLQYEVIKVIREYVKFRIEAKKEMDKLTGGNKRR